MSEATAECKETGVVMPVINRNKCEGKAACVKVCPYDVFEIKVLPAAERAELSFLGRLKARFHGWEQAYAVKAADCHACGKCVTACPEEAITLARP